MRLSGKLDENRATQNADTVASEAMPPDGVHK